VRRPAKLPAAAAMPIRCCVRLRTAVRFGPDKGAIQQQGVIKCNGFV
jgi:hypothetical protein